VIQELRKHNKITRQDLAGMLGVDPKTLRSRLRESGPLRVSPQERKNRAQM
jgi:transcriptional regulator with XRE-family HTH domain